MKIALYRDIELGFETVARAELDHSQSYIRVSEVVDIQFPMLEGSAATKQLDALMKRRTEHEKNSAKELSRIDKRIAELHEAMGVPA